MVKSVLLPFNLAHPLLFGLLGKGNTASVLTEIKGIFRLLQNVPVLIPGRFSYDNGTFRHNIWNRNGRNKAQNKYF